MRVGLEYNGPWKAFFLRGNTLADSSAVTPQIRLSGYTGLKPYLATGVGSWLRDLGSGSCAATNAFKLHFWALHSPISNWRLSET